MARSELKARLHAGSRGTGKANTKVADDTTRDVMDGLRPKDRILSVASHLFAERGFHGVTIREIAIGAACQLPALYRDFENKEALYLAACEMVFSEISRRYINIMTSTDSPEVALFRHVVTFYRDLIVDDRVRKLFIRETLFNEGTTINLLAKNDFVPPFKILVELCKHLTDRRDVEQSAFEVYTFAFGYIQMATLGRASGIRSIKWDNPTLMARRILNAALPEINWNKVDLKVK